MSFAIGRAEKRLSETMASSNGPAGNLVTWTVDQQVEFAKIRDKLMADLEANPTWVISEAADRFADAFLLYTYSHGHEVGANIVPANYGLSVADVRLGGTRVAAVFNLNSLAYVHTHPSNSGAGFSGYWKFYGGKNYTSHDGDYHTFQRNAVSGYVYRAGDKAAWHFDRPAFIRAQVPGANIDASDSLFTRRIR